MDVVNYGVNHRVRGHKQREIGEAVLAEAGPECSQGVAGRAAPLPEAPGDMI
jgi:hypothetical protein